MVVAGSAGVDGGAPPPIPRLLIRQRKLLTLLRSLGAPVARSDLQQLLFLYCRDCQTRGADPPYEFVPERTGAHSFTMDADTRKLLERGVLSTHQDSWEISPSALRIATQLKDRHVASFVHRHRHLRGEALAALTYRKSPYHATRSELAAKLLREDQDSRSRIAAERAHQRCVPLATIGYERRSYEGFFNELLHADISLLCDVRRNPVSRRWGFSKRMLSAGCGRLGIRYEHLPELGIASSRRANLNTQSAYERLFAEYQESTLVREEGALSTIRGWIDAGERVALTCYERLPGQCHRKQVATAVADRLGRLLLPRHP